MTSLVGLWDFFYGACELFLFWGLCGMLFIRLLWVLFTLQPNTFQCVDLHVCPLIFTLSYGPAKKIIEPNCDWALLIWCYGNFQRTNQTKTTFPTNYVNMPQDLQDLKTTNMASSGSSHGSNRGTAACFDCLCLACRLRPRDPPAVSVGFWSAGPPHLRFTTWSKIHSGKTKREVNKQSSTTI